MMNSRESMTGEGIEASVQPSSSTTGETQPANGLAPLVFLLPALIDDDPAFDRVWEPIRKQLEIIRVSYLDWTELVKTETNFATLINHVKQQIENESPAGPVRIAGYSIGGCLAYALAHVLETEGRPVLRVAILDAAANIEPHPMPVAQRLQLRLRDLAKFRFRGALASIVAKVLTREKSLPFLRRMSRFRQTPLPFDFGRFLHQKLTMQLELRLFRRWWQKMSPPTPLLAAPTYVYKSEDFDNYKRADLGWHAYCADCKIIRVQGGHGTMLHADRNGLLLSSFVEVMKAGES